MIDTNVYELLLKEENLDKIQNLALNGKLVVYGCRVVRDELREIPKNKKIGRKNLRNLLLSVYDSVVGKRSFPAGSEIEALANEYLSAYNGGIPKYKIYPDFQIVATATIRQIHIIISEDDRTMKSQSAIEAYNTVNSIKMYTTPKLISFEEL